jgi:WhiB family redox-sensing transcriptional regulator
VNSENYPDFHSKGPASCTYVDPDMFFTDPKDENFRRDSELAKKICGVCVYKIECLTWALEENEVGVWGGTSELDRRQLRRKNRSSL